ncbi:hypothetical protein BKA67DRAFT_651682 [Truncatella angustata]|uniref:Ubiquinol-cytochrome-c reductase cytochrome c1 n=1 Tax=Truncatella angustata TaxID=152316 RepID=A0A9P8RET8_9PEZI|nr:uncharacterized protein BKA67DRAFT_651682 [Truncatella angustata]KAH6643292.1 hypothetical protein BKA67DRAFT_651682 [Truncatella angustata]
MNYTIAQRLRVYTAYKEIFVGEKANLRKNSLVRHVINQHESLLQQFTDLGLVNVVKIVQDLLQLKVFASKVKAASEFPELVEPACSQNEVQEASPQHAEELLIEIWPEYTDTAIDTEYSEGENKNIIGQMSQEVDAHAKGAETITLATHKPMGSSLLTPSRLPFKAQHFVLSEVQRILEECCFEFAQKWLPSVLRERQCGSAEEIELNLWTYYLRLSEQQIPRAALDLQGRDSLPSFLAVNHLRHIAVHRKNLTSQSIMDSVKSGLALTVILRDQRRNTLLQSILDELNKNITVMNSSRESAQNSASEKLEVIKRKRAELDEEEKILRADMQSQDETNTARTGALIQESVDLLLKKSLEDELKIDRGSRDGAHTGAEETLAVQVMGGIYWFSSTVMAYTWTRKGAGV